MAASGRKKKVLIIEDEMDMRFYIMSMVKTLGFEPVVAANGNKGMEILSQVNPDLIILDVMMPEKGGALVYQELKSDKAYKHIPTIVFSGVDRASFNHYIKMLNATIKEKIPEPEVYVEKTVDPHYLMERMRRLMA